MRKRFQRRAAIESVIGHLKSDHRLQSKLFKRVDRRPDQSSNGCCRIQLQEVDAGSLFLACEYQADVCLDNQPDRAMAT